MKSIPYLLITVALLLFTACQGDDSPISDSGKSATGYLSLTGVQLQQVSDALLSTRAVDEDLLIDIYTSDGTDTLWKHFDAGEAAASEKIEMNAGDYLLKAYTDNYETTYGDNVYGAAKYYVEQPFTIETGKVNYLTVDVPMTNFGVTFDLPDLSGWFTSYSFSVSYNGRTCRLSNIGDIAYFDLSDLETNLYISFSAVNKDGELLEENDNHYATSTLEAGKIYQVEYAIATKSLAIRE